MPLIEKFKVNAPHVSDNGETIIADYTYSFTEVDNSGETPSFIPKSKHYSFKTEKTLPKLGYVFCQFSPPR